MHLTRSILLSDYAGHPFTTELARSLASRGEHIAYTYCAGTVSPKGHVGGGLDVIAVAPGLTFEKYRPWRRLWSESRYGFALASVVWRRRPSVHVVCNMPLVTAAIVWLISIPLRVKFVVWFQDVQSGLAAGSLRNGWMIRALSSLETFVLRRAWRVLAISPELVIEAERCGVASHRVRFLENWAPLEKLPMLSADTAWGAELGLDRRPLFVYAGTLGRKHDPSLLVDLAAALQADGGHVVVVSEGEGADFIAGAVEDGSAPTNITVLAYQPFVRLPEVLATADVLVVLLDAHASRYSVPSKTLSYLCAGRPLLASMPLDNAAARIVAEAGAGLVADAQDRELFLELARQLAEDEHLRTQLGASGRRYAETHFAEKVVVDRFLRQLHDDDHEVGEPRHESN